ncbi:NACHT domain-containing protein [Streptomyces sp. NPDC059080]|uniref:NACHT domain-containing protein n=1 Tax=Streptomyces sp. NPDC059080 TaxID=3346718 RepID=UPI003688144E
MMNNGEVRNSVSGRADQLIQTGVVHGGVHVHHSGGRRLTSAAEVARQTLLRRAADEVALRGLYQFGELRVPWEVLPGPDAGAASGEGQILSSPAEVVDAFLAMSARRLVLVGGGGSGKSTLALLLARELGERAAADHTIPLPVLTTAASWDPERVHLRVWFVRQLAAQYPSLDKRLGQDVLVELVESGVVFPVLDGLDELPPEQRDLVLTALARTLSPSDTVILTCREGEFREAGGRDSLPALTLRSRPVDEKVAEQYLTGGQEKSRRHWAPVVDQLRAEPGGVLASALEMPLMLWLARRTATDTSPQLLADRNRLIDAQAVRDHLLDALVPAVFDAGPSATEPRKHRWQAGKAKAHLRFLARRFSHLQSRDLEWSRTAPRGAILVGQFSLIASLMALAFGYDFLQGLRYEILPVIFLSFSSVAMPAATLYGYRMVTSPDTKWFGWRELFLALTAPATLFFARTSEHAWQKIPLAMLTIVLILSFIFHFIRVFIRPGQAPNSPERLKRERHLALSCMTVIMVIAACSSLARATQRNVEPAAAWIFTLSSVIFAAAFVFLCTPWGRWHCGRAVLATTGQLPWRTQTFLEDARQLGVIRLSDGHYQFRHIALQKRLADLPKARQGADTVTTLDSLPYQFSRGLPWRRRRWKSFLLVLLDLTIMITVAWWGGSQDSAPTRARIES